MYIYVYIYIYIRVCVRLLIISCSHRGTLAQSASVDDVVVLPVDGTLRYAQGYLILSESRLRGCRQGRCLI